MVLVIAFGITSCSRNVSRIETHSLPSPNPSNYSFPFPLEEVHTRALQAFSEDHLFDHPVFGRSADSSHLEIMLSAECATNALFGKKVFLDPSNTNDIYLHSCHTPFLISSVYYGKNGGLPFIATFHLHLMASGSNTFVTITAADTEVINGTKFGSGPCGPGQGNNYVSVLPTTVEEYYVLRYLGSYLGVTNMPEVILPAH